MDFDTPDEETNQERKNQLQRIRRYWAIRWYKYKSILDWKWAMQFAFNPPYQYTMAMCGQYTPENLHKYYPNPPKMPHRNTVLTTDDYPSEAERLEKAAEKKRIKEEKKKTKLATEDIDADVGPSKTKRRSLKKKDASPPPATTDEDRAHAAAVEAAAAASLNDSIHDPAADADDESEHTPDAPPLKRQKLRIPLKKKPGEKPPASRGVRIQDPTDPPAPRKPIDTPDMVVEAPLASNPPRRVVPSEQRTKARHGPKNKSAAQPE